MVTTIRHGAWSQQWQKITWSGGVVPSKCDKRKGGKGRCGEPQTKECFLAASVGERSCDSPATKLTRKLQKSKRQAVEIQAKLNSRTAEEIDTRMQIIQLWTKIKKAIVNNRVPCQPVCKKMIPEERDVQWFLNATQAMIKKIDKEAAERRIQNWLSKMKRVLNRRSSAKEVSKDWRALSNFKRGRAPPITAVLVADQENQGEGVESVQEAYADETNEILQQIEKKWEPVFNRPKEANFEEFLERFRNYVQIQQCTIPELTGKDLKNKAKEISLTRSVAMCGWRTAEIKTLPQEIFDLFAILFKRIEESQIWPEILVQVVTTFIPKVDDEDLDKVNQKKLACPAPEEMRPINNASPWYSIYTSLRYEQMESWRNEVMPSSMHGSRKDHGVWDVSLEHMLEMEAAVEKDQCLGSLSLDWSKFFDSLERDTGNSLVQNMLGRDSNALGNVQAERTFAELSKARVKVGRAVQTQGKTRGNGFLQGPCYIIEVALMRMSVWTRAVETEADVQTTGLVDYSAVRSKRGKTRDQAMMNLRRA